MTIPFAFVPLDVETLDEAGASVKRDQQLTAFQLPNYQVVFAVPTAMFEAFYEAVAPFLSADDQHQLLMTLGAVESSAIQNQEYLEWMHEQENARKAA